MNAWYFHRILDSENYSKADADAIVIAYPSLLLIVTVAGDSNMYSYDSVPFLIPEMDCVRILSNTEHEMLQKVPSCVNNIFAINSQRPSSYLFGAFQKYEVSRDLMHRLLLFIIEQIQCLICPGEEPSIGWIFGANQRQTGRVCGWMYWSSQLRVWYDGSKEPHSCFIFWQSVYSWPQSG